MVKKQVARSRKIGITVAFYQDRLSPRGTRRRFIGELRMAIIRACRARKFGEEVAEELLRALPLPEHV